MLLKNCRFLITQDSERAVFEQIDVLLEKDQIKKIGKNLAGSPVIDCSKKIVLPGFINCHTHIGMQTLRGLCDDAELHAWLAKVVAAEKKLTKKEIFMGAKQACREMIATGTTTFAEHYTPIEPILEAAEQAHMRAVLFPSLFHTLADTDKVLTQTQQFIKEYAHHPLITFGFGPHSIYATSKKIFMHINKVKKNNLVHLHLAETRKERVDCYTKNALLPLQYLHNISFLNEHTILAHCIWLTKGELSLIAQSNAKVVHCPTSNMKLAGGGVMPLQEMIALGITVGLGTDSVVSNNSLDLFSEMKICALLQKHHYWDPTIASAQTVLDMATCNGAKVVGKETEIGSIEEGKKADIVLIEINEHITPITKKNVVSALVYAAKGSDVATVIVNGVILYEEKSFQFG